MNFARIFRSRWAALLWAGGVVWFAYDVASSAPSNAPAADATGAGVNAGDLAVLANAG